jgi:hypothetical protein
MAMKKYIKSYEELNASSLIFLKKRAKKGKYRIVSKSIFTKPKYHRRIIVETVISVIKRIFGDNNQNLSDKLRNKESKLKNVCYDIYHYTKISSIKIQICFLQSQKIMHSKSLYEKSF